MNNRSRISKEYKEVCKIPKDTGIGAKLVNNNLAHWTGSVAGPENTPYEGGFFEVDIKIPDSYPFQPPKMRFTTKVWHPNVSSANGAICLDILKDEWSPALTLRTALLSLQALLCCPNADDPQDAQVARQYKSNRKEFEATAKFWTETYAGPKKGPSDKQLAMIKSLVEMGFEAGAVEQALERYSWDQNRALNHLLSG